MSTPMNEPWPTSKFRPFNPAAREAVILTTGAMNPIHLGHVAMLHTAADRLRREGYDVVRAYVSPSHDGYVQPKAASTGTMGLSANFRLEVAQRAVADDPLVAVGSWEATKPGHWPDFPEVCEALRLCAGVRIFYVVGTDHATKCALWNGFGEIGVVVVPRTGDDPLAEQPAKRVFVALPAQGEAAGFSSTGVRAALAAGDIEAASRFLSPSAARFMLNPSAEEHAAFAEDFHKFGIRSPLPPSAPSRHGGGGVRIVGITGCSRSGKGWVSDGLKRAIAVKGQSVTVVGQDDYWAKQVEVSVRGDVRWSEEEPDCTDHAAFAAAIRAAAARMGTTGSGGVVIAEGFQLVHSSDVTQQLDRIYYIELDRDEARRRRCQPPDEITNPNPMTGGDWDDLVWPAHERYVAQSLTPLAASLRKLAYPKCIAERDAIVQGILLNIGLSTDATPAEIPGRAEVAATSPASTVQVLDRPAADGEVIGEIRNGTIATIWCECDGYCRVEQEGVHGFADARSFTRKVHRVLLNLRLSDEVATMHRNAVDTIAESAMTQRASTLGAMLVQQAVHEGRTYAHLTLCYDIEVTPSQLAQLMQLLASFASRERTVPMRMSGVGAFDDNVVYLDVDRTHPGYPNAMAIHTRLLAELRTLPFIPQAILDQGVHWHATIAMGFAARDAARIQACARRCVQPIDCAFDNITLMAKVGPSEPYVGTAIPAASFTLQETHAGGWAPQDGPGQHAQGEYASEVNGALVGAHGG